jgi:oxygen-independent coproporphyrinogen III oxidase
VTIAPATESSRDRSRRLLASEAYVAYAYSYPHKTAYRPLYPARPIEELWAEEDREALQLYLHVPFCEQRCGFCNLFTQAQPSATIIDDYVRALERQAAVVAEVVGDFGVALVAVGGGTPTFLPAALLDRVLGIAQRLGGAGAPTSVESSPSTLDPEKVDVLTAHGTTRLSLGVQSLSPHELRGVGRRQNRSDVERALKLSRDRFARRNVDLMYGLPDQTPATWRDAIDDAIDLGANELYLYPLYVRPLTTLGRKAAWTDSRLSLYRAGRDHLLSRGFEQRSMRCFIAPGVADLAPAGRVRAYRHQEDGMLGLGCGARSYTRSVHYSSPYAVSQASTKHRITEWIALPDAAHSLATHGFVLDQVEQRRRFVLLSLLEGGVDLGAFEARFTCALSEQFAEVADLIGMGLAHLDGRWLRLTPLGLERADVIGAWLESPAVSRARAEWTPS